MARIQIRIIFEGHFIQIFKYSNIRAHHWYYLALVYKSRAGQGTLISISRNIIHEIKAAAMVTKSYSN